MLAILARQASLSHSCEITQSNPSPQSGMVQPVVNEMFATVHAAGSSLLGLFTSCTTFDSTESRLAPGMPSCLLRPTGAGLGACTRIFRHSAQPRKHLPSRTPIFPVAASPY
eukprot:scaffold3360_cov112-Isochrysis_galbana.AAC.2